MRTPTDAIFSDGVKCWQKHSRARDRHGKCTLRPNIRSSTKCVPPPCRYRTKINFYAEERIQHIKSMKKNALDDSTEHYSILGKIPVTKSDWRIPKKETPNMNLKFSFQFVSRRVKQKHNSRLDNHSQLLKYINSLDCVAHRRQDARKGKAIFQ